MTSLFGGDAEQSGLSGEGAVGVHRAVLLDAEHAQRARGSPSCSGERPERHGADRADADHGDVDDSGSWCGVLAHPGAGLSPRFGTLPSPLHRRVGCNGT
nr:hypothetical protein [Pseudoclavibacter sp. 13-3]